MTGRKPFSRSLYADNDNIAKIAGYHHCLSMGAIWVSINKNDYGCDLVYRTEDTNDPDVPPKCLEVEVKRTWKHGPLFPYETINVLYRKKKYFDAGCDLLLVSGDLEHTLFLTADTILDCDLEEVPNKYVSSMELFYKVPREKATYHKYPLSKGSDPICSCTNRSFNVVSGRLLCESCQSPHPMI